MASSTPVPPVLAAIRCSPSAAAAGAAAPTGLSTAAARHVQRTERVRRIDVQRRALREALRENDEMLADVDAHLAYIAQLKRDWLHHMRSDEIARQQMLSQEAGGRRVVEENERSAAESLLLLEIAPALRRLREREMGELHAQHRRRLLAKR